MRGHRWQVEALGGETDAAQATCSTVVEPSEAPPFHARLVVTYRLRGFTLGIDARVVSLGHRPMPIGFGLHPWFDIPFAHHGSRATAELRAPANALWELRDLIPTGATVPVDGQRDLRAWRPLNALALDDVYTDLVVEDGWFTAAARDPASGRAVAVRSDAAFREHVVYAPLARDVVCLEPYSCPTDAFNLAARGINAGVVELEPGGEWRGSIEIEATPDLDRR